MSLNPDGMRQHTGCDRMHAMIRDQLGARFSRGHFTSRHTQV